MTHIELSNESNEWSIECKGHAGYASVGNDIVCAAISTLTQTLIEYLLEQDIEVSYHANNGYLWIYCDDPKSQVARDVIVSGLKLVAMSYNQYIKIVEGCPINRKFPLQ